jgi:palmitoyltransferase
MPAFLLTLLLAPIALNICCLPIYGPFGRRFLEAWRFSRVDGQFAWWWNWWPSWIVAGGPIGRYGVAVALAWREMDREDGGGLFRFSSGVLIGLGLLLSAIAGVSSCVPM